MTLREVVDRRRQRRQVCSARTRARRGEHSDDTPGTRRRRARRSASAPSVDEQPRGVPPRRGIAAARRIDASAAPARSRARACRARDPPAGPSRRHRRADRRRVWPSAPSAARRCASSARSARRRARDRARARSCACLRPRCQPCRRCIRCPRACDLARAPQIVGLDVDAFERIDAVDHDVVPIDHRLILERERVQRAPELVGRHERAASRGRRDATSRRAARTRRDRRP